MKFHRTTTLFGKYTKRSDAIQVELRHSCIVFVSFERPAMNRSVRFVKLIFIYVLPFSKAAFNPALVCISPFLILDIICFFTAVIIIF